MSQLLPFLWFEHCSNVQSRGKVNPHTQRESVFSLSEVQQKHLVIFKKVAVIRENYCEPQRGHTEWIFFHLSIMRGGLKAFTAIMFKPQIYNEPSVEIRMVSWCSNTAEEEHSIFPFFENLKTLKCKAEKHPCILNVSCHRFISVISFFHTIRNTSRAQ